MAVITLTTGWIDDYYIAVVKGIILSAIPSVQIVDISHHTPAFNTGISYAAYMISHSYIYYPKNTVHLISVASEYTEKTPFIAAQYEGQYFVGTDNGIFSLIFRYEPEDMVRIEKYTDAAAPNYPAISVFAPAAIHLASGGNISDLGSTYTTYQRKGMLMATIDESQITGTIIHINAFGNVITNITREDFDRIGKGRPFEIMVQSIRNKITRINKYYHETSDGELLALFDVSGLLEIAMNKGKIAEMLNLSLNSNIIVKFLNVKI
ncbi:MAG: SAM-dependent chlorinase/fluorinase [Bacteroidales bacterium]|jgi:S-adenosylmethionine hydrolase|nr:SAM-dependent chlorinase/fluorinase [Bacteroidales bacterium]